MRIVSFASAVPGGLVCSDARVPLAPSGQDVAAFRSRPVASARAPQFAGLTEGKLLKAIRKGETEKAKALLSENPELINQETGRWFFRTYPIIHAAWQDNLELVRFMLQNGADPNLQNERSGPALNQAVMNKSQPMLKLLLDYGADPNRIANDYSPFMWAVAGGDTDLAEIMLTRSKIPVNLDLQGDYSGKTALMLAARGDYADLVYRLLKLGADPLLKDREGKTALMHARLTPQGYRRTHSASARLLNDAIGKRIRTYGDLTDSGKLGMHQFLAKLAGKDPWEEIIERFDAMSPDKQTAFIDRLLEWTAPEA